MLPSHGLFNSQHFVRKVSKGVTAPKSMEGHNAGSLAHIQTAGRLSACPDSTCTIDRTLAQNQKYERIVCKLRDYVHSLLGAYSPHVY